MGAQDLISLTPHIILSIGTLVVMIQVIIGRSHLAANAITLITLAASFFSLFQISSSVPHEISNIMITDGFSLFYAGLIIASSFIVAMLSFNYFDGRNVNYDEYYMLLLLATLGTVVMVSSQHFISLFLGLEILSVSLYTMIGYFRNRDRSIEAGIKYLILAAASSAFLLFGMGLIYTDLGSMQFSGIADGLSKVGATPLVLAGFSMMIVGVGFKLAVAPFHMWTPDVYEGAPAPVTALIASISKGGMFGALLRFFVTVDGTQYHSLIIVFTVIAIASMFIGNILALLQNNVKRILAFSSIAHLGYLLVAFIASGSLGAEAATFYLVAYSVTILGSFGIVSILSDKERDAEGIIDYRGLFWRRPLLSVVFVAMLLSLAGIPLTAGFIGKYYVVASGVQANLWLLAIMLVINSVIGLYYYLRIVATMLAYTKEEEEKFPALNPTFSLSGVVALAVLTLLVVWLGVLPSNMIQVVEGMVSSIS